MVFRLFGAKPKPFQNPAFNFQQKQTASKIWIKLNIFMKGISFELCLQNGSHYDQTSMG